MDYAWKGSLKVEGTKKGDVAGVKETLGDAPGLEDHREDPASRIKIKDIFQEISHRNKPSLGMVGELTILWLQFSDIRTDNYLVVSVLQ